MNIFVFDLDSTVTKAELLPEIAKAVDMDIDMAHLTQQALDGAVPFEESFRQRFDLLKHVPLNVIRQVADKIAIDENIGKFIREHPMQCVIATGNVDIWVKPITDKLGCRVFASHAEMTASGLPCLVTVLYKRTVLQSLRSELSENSKIVAIGDSANDIPMFELADYAVAYGGVNEPTDKVKSAAHAFINDSTDLVQRLLYFCD